MGAWWPVSPSVLVPLVGLRTRVPRIHWLRDLTQSEATTKFGLSVAMCHGW